MAKVKNNIVTEGLSGSVGNLVAKAYKDKTVISKKPAPSRFPRTEKQKAASKRFAKATEYAKEALNDPKLLNSLTPKTNQTTTNALIQKYMNEHKNEQLQTSVEHPLTADDLKQLGCNNMQIKAVKYLQNKKQLDNAIYRKLNNVSKATATRHLQYLVTQNIIRSSALKGAGACYVLIK